MFLIVFSHYFITFEVVSVIKFFLFLFVFYMNLQNEIILINVIKSKKKKKEKIILSKLNLDDCELLYCT